MRFLGVCCCLGIIGFSSTWAADRVTPDNSWIKPSDGKWEEAGAWSLGILPARDQEEIYISNANAKTVEIDATTAANFPSSLMLHRLVLDGTNTLKLNRMGRNGALQFVTESRWTGMEVRHDASVISLDSDIVMNGYFGVSGKFEHEGGRVAVEHSSSIHGGSYSLTNGLFETGDQLIVWAR